MTYVRKEYIMPGRDGTGPMGQGPMTGRGFGACGRARPGAYYYGCGRGIGRGMGLGIRRGFGGWFGQPNASVDPAEEKEWLKSQKNFLKARLDEIDAYLKGSDDK